MKRVEIPKDNGGVRLLGVPCVRDILRHCYFTLTISWGRMPNWVITNVTVKGPEEEIDKIRKIV